MMVDAVAPVRAKMNSTFGTEVAIKRDAKRMETTTVFQPIALGSLSQICRHGREGGQHRRVGMPRRSRGSDQDMHLGYDRVQRVLDDERGREQDRNAVRGLERPLVEDAGVELGPTHPSRHRICTGKGLAPDSLLPGGSSQKNTATPTPTS